MINPENSWELIKINASKALKVSSEWHSLVENKKYTLEAVLNDRIIIKRLSGGYSQELTEKKVLKTIKKFNSNNCIIKRRHLLSPTVAEETALVLFHPNLSWDKHNEYIIEI